MVIINVKLKDKFFHNHVRCCLWPDYIFRCTRWPMSQRVYILDGYISIEKSLFLDILGHWQKRQHIFADHRPAGSGCLSLHTYSGSGTQQQRYLHYLTSELSVSNLVRANPCWARIELSLSVVKVLKFNYSFNI